MYVVLSQRGDVGDQNLQFRLVVSDSPRQQQAPFGVNHHAVVVRLPSVHRGPDLDHPSSKTQMPASRDDHAGIALHSDPRALPNQRPRHLGAGRPSKSNHMNGSALTVTSGSLG
jgi:hypothetical protein